MNLTRTKFEEWKDALAKAEPAVLAVDPGLTGAVAYLNAGRVMVRRDFKHLAEIVTAIKSLWLGLGMVFITEDVHAMPGQGVSSMFSFGDAYGVAKGAAWEVMGDGQPVEIVAPQKWQNFYRRELEFREKTETMDREEFSSVAICNWLFPEYQLLFKRKKDHNTADAVLIAVWRAISGECPRVF